MDSGEQRAVLVQRPGGDDLGAYLPEGVSRVDAANGTEALAKIDAVEDRASIGLVAADEQLVDMSGVDLLAKLAGQLPDAARVLVNDAEDVSLLLAAVNRAHVHGYLQRPLDADAARSLLGDALTRHGDRRRRQAESLAAALAEKDAELDQAHELIEQASITDPLTGLYNRRYMQNHFHTDLKLIEREFHDREDSDEQHDLLFLLADVDDFTPVNEIYGHGAGDRLLEDFACRLRDAFRGSDIIVRWGGDQFLVVARFARRDGGEGIAERLRAAIASEPFDLGKGIKPTKSCTVGFAPYPFFTAAPDIIEWTRVVNFADQARAVSKRSGTNGWVGFEPRQDVEPLDAAKRILSSPGQACASGILKVTTSHGSPSLLKWD